MAENHQADAEPGLAALVGGILEDAQRLVRQEVALAQREVAQAWDKAKTGVALLASALAVCGMGGVLLGFMLVKFLQQYLLPNHEWACFAIVGGLVTLLGGALIKCGLNQINQVHLSLPQTAETLREDAQAVSDAVSGGRPTAHALLKR
jgi:Putative Actinobacterial Holin-X, holin superfamily III